MSVQSVRDASCPWFWHTRDTAGSLARRRCSAPFCETAEWEDAAPAKLAALRVRGSQSSHFKSQNTLGLSEEAWAHPHIRSGGAPEREINLGRKEENVRVLLSLLTAGAAPEGGGLGAIALGIHPGAGAGADREA